MGASSETVKESNRKPARRKYIIAAVIIFLCILAGLFYRAMTWEPKPDPVSEKIIREFTSRQLYEEKGLKKEPNDLTDEDFAKIITFSFWEKNKNGVPVLIDKDISDIKLLENFINLQELTLGVLNFPVDKIPKWMKCLAKSGIYNLDEIYTLDVSPLEKLPHLQKVILIGKSVKNIKPLSGITNLKHLQLMQTQVDNLEPIRNLTILEHLDITNSPVSNLEPIKNLTNLQYLLLRKTEVSNIKPLKKLINMKSLGLSYTKVNDIEPLEGLINLQEFNIYGTQITDLEPIKEFKQLKQLNIGRTPVSDLAPLKNLTELKELNISDCNEITDEQVEDLQKALPNLKIRR